LKRLVVLIVFICLASSGYCGWWDGGPARVQALGGVDIVLQDASNIVDLYSLGHTSMLVYREKANVAAMAAQSGCQQYDISQNDIINKWGVIPGFGVIIPLDLQNKSNTVTTGLLDPQSNYYIFWISPDDVLRVQPLYENVFTGKKLNESGLFESEFRGSESVNQGSGSLEYAHNFGNNMSAGAMFGYGVIYDTADGSGAPIMGKSDVYDLTGFNETRYFMNYLLDFSIKLNPESVLALSAGSVLPRNLGKKFPLGSVLGNTHDIIDTFNGPDYDGTFGSGVITGVPEFYAGKPVSIDSAIASSGYNLNLGYSYLKSSAMELAVNAGLILDYADSLKLQSDEVYLDQSEAGIGYNASAKFRAFIGDNWTAGIMAQANAVDYKFSIKDDYGETTGMDTAYITDESAGLSYKAGSITIPVELFAHFMNGNYIFNRYGGVRGGVEWNAVDWLSLRLGGSLPFVTEYVYPFTIKSAYQATGGIGLIFGAFKTDIGISYTVMNYDLNYYSLGGLQAQTHRNSNFTGIVDMTYSM
jgi:hypothetical protein